MLYSCLYLHACQFSFVLICSGGVSGGVNFWWTAFLRLTLTANPKVDNPRIFQVLQHLFSFGGVNVWWTAFLRLTLTANPNVDNPRIFQVLMRVFQTPPARGSQLVQQAKFYKIVSR